MNEIRFSLDEKEYCLYFGMDACEIIVDKLEADLAENKSGTFRALANIIYGGLVNASMLFSFPKPTYNEAYFLMESVIAKGDDLGSKIFDCYNSSLADKMLKKYIDSLLPKKKEQEAEKPKKQIGTK